jgi:hypothetical protein
MDEANPLGVKLGLFCAVLFFAIAVYWQPIKGHAISTPDISLASGLVFVFALLTARKAYASGFKAGSAGAAKQISD